MFWFGVICQLVPIVKIIAGGLGYHFADPLLDQMGDFCAVGSQATGAVLLAKSPKMASVPALRKELAKKS